MKNLLLAAFALLCFSACKKTTQTPVIYNVQNSPASYEVEYSDGAGGFTKVTGLYKDTTFTILFDGIPQSKQLYLRYKGLDAIGNAARIYIDVRGAIVADANVAGKNFTAEIHN